MVPARHDGISPSYFELGYFEILAYSNVYAHPRVLIYRVTRMA